MPKSKSFLQAVINPFKFHSKTDKEGDLDTISAQEQRQFTFQTLVAATKDFHPSNKLGQGGFGPVFKGKLEDGREIAVKKLSQNSSQGKKEFMNEARLLMKVQHRNVVTLLGYCAYGAEKLLVYEYVANESVDKLLFKFGRQEEFDWNKRYATITGVARGLLYLHEDAHTCIIHRDIKASNILLDDRWIPKIADFGMARLYPEDETHVHTRVAGTSGYMAPEYVMHGNLSIKADVYSFGVLLLEIISGQKNSTFSLDPDCQSLLDWAYKFYKRDQTLEIVDKKLASSVVPDQAALCIQIGLLCTQSDPQLRPTMGRVVIMLSKKLGTLEVPTRPGYLGTRYRRSQRGNTSSSTAGISVESSSRSSDLTNYTNTASASALSATATASTSTNNRLGNPRGMSGKSGRRPPFLQKSGAIPVAKTAPIPAKPKTAELPPPPPLSQNTEIVQRTQGTPEDHISKKARKDESVLPAPKHPATATPVHHLFAKHGYNHATEEECTSWVGAELIDNAESLSKCLSEAFIRQTSHLKELKTLASVKAKLEKEVSVLKFQKEEDKRSLMKTHRLALETETASLRSELKKITDERNMFSKCYRENIV